MIGTAIKPRSFNSFNFQDYIEYGSSRNGWMTSTLYKSWMTKLNQKMTKQNRKIILLVDNCPSHTQIPLSNVKIAFLSPNKTGLLQSLDLGVIRSFKCFFRKQQMLKMLTFINSGISVFDAYRSLTLKDVVLLIHFAWDKVIKDNYSMLETISDNNEYLLSRRGETC